MINAQKGEFDLC